ncbi:M23 family metallopeptidase [Alicyclobacillus macrosporangiidus]|uniref:M23 family metallopeptidase n=1 Tax=Alicyclobacillus macrosporangiidus TaxID=392015 RepID=UPI000A7F50D5|nr:M23 family metallopeptidase [Alicyclobacillus macrosporangiidus]
MNKRCIFVVVCALVAMVAGWGQDRPVSAAERKTQEELMPIYRKAAADTGVSWTLLAAVDRYAELMKTKGDRERNPFYGFAFEPAAWAGIDNPNWLDIDPMTIRLFHGLGRDGNGDGMALPWDPQDRIPVLAEWLDELSGEDDEEVAIWDLFQDPVAMDRIAAFQTLFDKYGLNPKGHCFPVSKRANYTVKHTFGAGRSWGGRRIHEGVDIFAPYGTPVLACSYGYVELMGWNRYGGWRIGIRDVNNVYYYYAHLSSYAKGLKRGDVVEPGQIIGYVGSSGYGPPGTSGKFPPHLHFGVYRDTGRGEWAFNPSALLAQWQRLPQHVKYPGKST